LTAGLPTEARPEDVVLLRDMVAMGIPVELGAAAIEEELLKESQSSTPAFRERAVSNALVKNECNFSGSVSAERGGSGSVRGCGRGSSSAAGGGASHSSVIVIDSDNDDIVAVGAPTDLVVESGVDGLAGDEGDAVMRPPVASSGLGTHKQTAAELLSFFNPTFLNTGRQTATSESSAPPVSPPLDKFGVSLAPTPLALLSPLPPAPSFSSSPLVEVFLVVDKRETHGSGIGRSAFLARLRAQEGLVGCVEERTLPVGDALLVARVTSAGQDAFPGAPEAGTELLLPRLFERKTVCDLAASFRDARCMEQAYYMAASGLPSLTLVVEGDVGVSRNDGQAVVSAELHAYLSELDVTGGFFIKYTDSVEETAAYYSSMVRYSGRRLQTADGLANYLSSGGGGAIGPETAARAGASGGDGPALRRTYAEWVAVMCRMRGSCTLQQLWALQLHVLPGVGGARVDTMLAAGFTTPASLAAAYKSVASAADGRALLARLEPPPGRVRFSMQLSTLFYDLFCAEGYGSRLV